MHDHEILDLYFARSEQAIVETKGKYGKYIRYIAEKIVHDASTAEECENDVYLDAWNSIPPNRPKPFKTYLASLARRNALDRYDEKAAGKRGGGLFPSSAEELSDCLPSTEGDPADALILRETVASFLRSLPKKTRRIFLQRYWYAQSIAEIAEEFRMSESAVKMTLKRARDELKKRLEI